ncbi:hypothetical protein DSLASN_04730 [Desulfoluna limicola]|uniref:Uncharacterized protein n=1 Tax=Desulfoluna limicola TaxID=2810562 RepID=A0ABN6EYY6_9BACT|nr:hypothetical protein DSLASN_04730 [Desulfoluna limicola]
MPAPFVPKRASVSPRRHPDWTLMEDTSPKRRTKFPERKELEKMKENSLTRVPHTWLLVPITFKKGTNATGRGLPPLIPTKTVKNSKETSPRKNQNEPPPERGINI